MDMQFVLDVALALGVVASLLLHKLAKGKTDSLMEKLADLIDEGEALAGHEVPKADAPVEPKA